MAIVCPCARWVEAMTSLALERGADPGRDRLLADRDVQEAGKLARAEALLDLLLEAPDQEHLAEEARAGASSETPLPAGLGLLLDLRHRSGHYADRPMKLVEQWSGARGRASDADWDEVAARAHGRGARPRRPGRRSVLGPLQPGRAGDELVFHVDAARRQAPERLAERAAHGSTASGSGARSRSSTSARRRAAPAERGGRAHGRRSPTAGTRRSRRCRPTGATSSASSSSTRATSCRAPRSSARRSTRPATPTRSRSGSAARGRPATAPRRRWRGAASSAGRGRDHRARHRAPRALGHGQRRHAGPGLAHRGPLGLSATGQPRSLLAPG